MGCSSYALPPCRCHFWLVWLFEQDDADLDPLSAMEKYCRSELPQQRLAYAAVREPAANTTSVISSMIQDTLRSMEAGH